MDKKRLLELAGVPLEEQDRQQMFDDVLAQFKNLEVYKPRSMDELRRTGPAIVAVAKDLVAAVSKLDRELSSDMIEASPQVKEAMEESKAKYITDLGPEFPLDVSPEGGGDKIHIHRYGVWGDKGRGKPEIIDHSDDIKFLKRKHGELPLVRLGKK